MFATVAMLSAALSGFGIAAPPTPSPPREKVPARDPNGPAPWLAQTLPPLDPPKPNRERVREVKRRSKAERLQRRKKRKQRSKG